jgi:hypothetical protein
MSLELSVCGCDCFECDHYKNSKCAGCSQIKGKVYWAGFVNADVCPVYACVVSDRGYRHCGECPDIPCKLWHDLKDPSHTDEQHETGIADRVKRLKELCGE